MYQDMAYPIQKNKGEILMFNNIGGKIKKLAMVVCVIGMIGSFVAAVNLWTNSSRYNDTTLTGIVVLVVGCLASWIGSFFTYGFGQLIERTEESCYHLSQMQNRQNR